MARDETMTQTAAPATLLIVDDERTLRFTIGEWAKDSGFRAIEAENGRDAVTAVREQGVDVVLLDLKLGDGGSGFDVLRAVHPQAPGIDFYLLSNFSTPAYRRSAEELGARGFFDKTQEFGRLMDLLAERARRAP